MNRVAFLIDGFNVYHSAIAVSKALNGATTKWLNLDSLCRSYLPLIGKDTNLEGIYYFSALATHTTYRNPDRVKRHKIFIQCLESTGVKIYLGRFKQKDVWCKSCQKKILCHEEKETDVAIAVKLLEGFFTDSCDTAVLLTGDTDVAPAVRKANELFPSKTIIFAFPYKRKNKELAKLCPGSFKISQVQYTNHQFPNPVILGDGREIFKPGSW